LLSISGRVQNKGGQIIVDPEGAECGRKRNAFGKDGEAFKVLKR
jgi:hypothetical protein